ncbi:SDR family oxidoreductase [Vibrio pacinii]|uniref:SDR family oxidoreductase n=1 Tax=Vibrio pacinii TaxID=170674 RepID=UPI00056E7D19|nr:SDR family oxidoreductase [Vibrio pacinii]
MSKKLLIVGSSSFLSEEITRKFNNDFEVFNFGRGKLNDKIIDVLDLSSDNIFKIFEDDFDFYVFNLGHLLNKNIVNQTEQEIISSIKINSLFSIKSSEYILSTNDRARIIIIGSESGKKGSYDTSYFISKSILRSYVKERFLYSQNQQLILISPSTIEDSAMTMSRIDTERLNTYRNNHPKKRFLSNSEVVDVIYDLLSKESTYLTNIEIEINGGKFARMKY